MEKAGVKKNRDFNIVSKAARSKSSLPVGLGAGAAAAVVGLALVLSYQIISQKRTK